MSLVFDSRELGEPSYEYVAWIDVMGTHSTMSRSISASANFMSKLHIAALLANTATVRLYPVMDGFYASSPTQKSILDFITSVFTEVATAFSTEKEPHHRFMIRGGLAYGPVYHGSMFTEKASDILNKNPSHRDALLMGMPVIQANSCESQAPPFGVFVHESARAFSPKGENGIPHIWWKWVNTSNKTTWTSTEAAIKKYFKWCKEHSLSIGYSSERIKTHEEMAKQYFTK